jgi:hypothetical protein
MSRTYRRKGAEVACKVTFNRYDEEYQGDGVYILRERTDQEIAKEKAEFYSDSYARMTTPMWWFKMTTTVPNRRKQRDLIKSLIKTKHLDELEAAIFPLWKKPHIYYW